jgi:mitochondrial import inner membrane translocase subunit TIM44
MASFHSSSRHSDQLPKSPFQTFVDVLRDELRKNRELQENVKQLQGDVDKFQDSETMRKARAAYERARVRFTFPDLPKTISVEI